MSTTFKARNIREHFRISTATINRWVASGKLPEPQYINNQRVWKFEDIEEAEKKLSKPSFEGKVSK